MNDPGLVTLKAKVKQRVAGSFLHFVVGFLIGYLLNYFALFCLCARSSTKFKSGLVVGACTHIAITQFLDHSGITKTYVTRKKI
jgi:hypothetical protein